MSDEIAVIRRELDALIPVIRAAKESAEKDAIIYRQKDEDIRRLRAALAGLIRVLKDGGDTVVKITEAYKVLVETEPSELTPEPKPAQPDL